MRVVNLMNIFIAPSLRTTYLEEHVYMVKNTQNCIICISEKIATVFLKCKYNIWHGI